MEPMCRFCGIVLMLCMAESIPVEDGDQPRDLEHQVTSDAGGHILTNVNCWSPDGRWLVYDRRVAEDVFDGERIERVNVDSGKVEVLYTSSDGAHCGVVTCSPVDNRVVFIVGPENPTEQWSYCARHRRGVVVDAAHPGRGATLDARDLTNPYTPGALRGGTHVHVFSGDGQWVSSTYEDAVLADAPPSAGADLNQRNVAVSAPFGPVHVKQDHPRNHDGTHFTVLVTCTTNQPRAGSDEISRAFSDAWVGTNGYLRVDGTRQKRAIAFQGDVVTTGGGTISEVFIVDLPDDLAVVGQWPLEGTPSRRPAPPKGTVQRRLTHTDGRKHPGLQGPRHWLRSSPDGSRIAFLMKDDDGIVHIWTISPHGGDPIQVSHNRWSVQSAFSWSPDGRFIAYAADNSIMVTQVDNGHSVRVTRRFPDSEAPTHLACVFAPDGHRIAYMRPVVSPQGRFHQLFFVRLSDVASGSVFPRDHVLGSRTIPR